MDEIKKADPELYQKLSDGVAASSLVPENDFPFLNSNQTDHWNEGLSEEAKIFKTKQLPESKFRSGSQSLLPAQGEPPAASPTFGATPVPVGPPPRTTPKRINIDRQGNILSKNP